MLNIAGRSVVALYQIHHAQAEDGAGRPDLALLVQSSAKISLPDGSARRFLPKYMNVCTVPLVPLPDARHSAAGFVRRPIPGVISGWVPFAHLELTTGASLVIPCADGESAYHLRTAWDLAEDAAALQILGAPPLDDDGADCPLGAALGALFAREYPGCVILVGQGFYGSGSSLMACLIASPREPRFGFPPTAHERMAERRT